MVRILIEQMEAYAKEHHVPIMEPDGIEFLLKLIEKNHVKSILEIGTAIGYSAIRMASLNSRIHVTSIERDEQRYQLALQNIEKSGLQNQIQVLFQDALDVTFDQKYDLIFIDAAKSQYIKFFEKFKQNLNPGGIIVSDNLNFHGLTHTKEPIASRNVRGLVRKLNEYIVFLRENNEFDTTFYEIGDGVGVSIQKVDK